MKKLLILFSLLICFAAFGQSPVKVIRVANKTALFVDNLPKSTIIIDTQTKSRYLTLLPVLGTKSIATCTGLELRLDVINGDFIEVLTATDTTEAVSPRNMFDYMKVNTVPYIGANQDLNLGTYNLIGDTINATALQINGTNVLNNVRFLQNHDSLSTLDEKSYNSLTDKPSLTQLHDPITLAGTYDYITLSGQQITRNQIDYSSDISNIPATFTPTIHGNEAHTSAFIIQSDAIIPNIAIAPNTKTKIQYDAKGLVVSGSDATTSDISDSIDKRYITDSQQSSLSNIHILGSDNQTLTIGGTTSPTIGLSGSNTATFVAGSGILLGQSEGNITILNTAPNVIDGDGSVLNEKNTSIGWTNATNTISVVDPQGTVSAVITGFLESEIDGSITNEAQSLSVTGTSSPIITLSAANGSGGGTATLVSGAGISLNNSPAGTIMVTNTSPNATHTGDATGATTLTLATVNSNIGTFNNITINAKGLATAGSNIAYLVADDISGKKDKSDSTAIDGYTRRDRVASELAKKQNKLNGTGFVKATGTTISYDNSTYEPAFSKNTGFNKNFGSTAGTVLEGRTFGTAANNNTGDFEVPLTFGTGLQRSVNTVTTFLGSLSNDITATTSDYIPWIDVGTSNDKKMTIATLSNLTSKWTTETYGISNSGNVGIGAVADVNYRLYSSANVADYGAKISNTSTSGKGLLIQGGSDISHAFSIVPFGGGSLSYFNVFGNGVVQMYQATPGTATAGSGLLFVDTDDKIKWKTSTTIYDLTGGGGMTNPMTTTGDIIYSSSGSTPTRRGIGTSGQVLTVSGGLPVWVDAPNNSGWTDNGSAVNLSTQTRPVGIGVAADISKKMNVLSSSGYGIYSYNSPNIAIQGATTSGVGVSGISTTGKALSGEATGDGGRAVYGWASGVAAKALWGEVTGNGSTGVYGKSTNISGIGLKAENTAEGYAGSFSTTGPSINSVLPIITIARSTSGTAATGIGAGINFGVENANNYNLPTGSIEHYLSNANAESTSSEFRVTTLNNNTIVNKEITAQFNIDRYNYAPAGTYTTTENTGTLINQGASGGIILDTSPQHGQTHILINQYGSAINCSTYYDFSNTAVSSIPGSFSITVQYDSSDSKWYRIQ